MAATIIDVQAINDSISNANRLLSEQEEILDEIDGTVNSMSGVWEAEDQRVYAERFQTTRKKIQDFNSSVSESLRSIKKYVDDCVSADNQTARELRSISW